MPFVRPLVAAFGLVYDVKSAHRIRIAHTNAQRLFRLASIGDSRNMRNEIATYLTRSQRGHPLVDLSMAEGKLTLHVRGADKLWAFKSSLEIPLAHIVGVRADPEPARGWYHGIRMPGTNVPGVITAGTFYQDGKRIFWDVHHPEKTIVIDLHDERFNQLIVEVADPQAAVKSIQNAL
jgi:hypothetical protein